MEPKDEKNEYLITFTCGDTYNIPTYKIIECCREELEKKLDDDYDVRFSWRDKRRVNIFKIEEIIIDSKQ